MAALEMVMGRPNGPLVWREVAWPRPFTPEAALDCLARLATDRGVGAIVFEARGDGTGIHYLIGCAAEQAAAVAELVSSQVLGTRLSGMEQRADVDRAARLRISHRSLALSTDRVMAAVRSVLAALAAARAENELLVLQIMLGSRVAPRNRWLLLSVLVTPAETTGSNSARSTRR